MMNICILHNYYKCFAHLFNLFKIITRVFAGFATGADSIIANTVENAYSSNSVAGGLIPLLSPKFFSFLLISILLSLFLSSLLLINGLYMRSYKLWQFYKLQI